MTFLSIINKRISCGDPDISFLLDGSDDVGITKWMITESSVKPYTNSPGWSDIKPLSYTLSDGLKPYTLYAWAKDLAGNVSDSLFFDVELKHHHS